jgi:hypothetical protein
VPLVRLLVGQQSMSDGCTNLVSLGNQFTLGPMAQAIAKKSRPKGKLGVECRLRCYSPSIHEFGGRFCTTYRCSFLRARFENSKNSRKENSNNSDFFPFIKMSATGCNPAKSARRQRPVTVCDRL